MIAPRLATLTLLSLLAAPGQERVDIDGALATSPRERDELRLCCSSPYTPPAGFATSLRWGNEWRASSLMVIGSHGSAASGLMQASWFPLPRPGERVRVRGRRTSDDIRLNQIGFYPHAPKRAFVVGASSDTFYVLTPTRSDTVYSGVLGPWRSTDASSDSTRLAEFSALRDTGRYVLHVPGLGDSHPFEIRPRVHEPVARAALKGFYYQRASTALEPRFAGEWARAAGHPDTSAVVHASAASPERPTGTVIRSPGGWYDAGDYNKYVVNSGITVATLLSLYEDFPEYAAALDAGVPESGNTLPDLLDETLWNLRWMLAMQDPGDGGVYHKLTAANFEAFIMPFEARAPRYIVQKSTAATLDFAAVMAQASRVLRRLAQEPVPQAGGGPEGVARPRAASERRAAGGAGTLLCAYGSRVMDRPFS